MSLRGALAGQSRFERGKVFTFTSRNHFVAQWSCPRAIKVAAQRRWNNASGVA